MKKIWLTSLGMLLALSISSCKTTQKSVAPQEEEEPEAPAVVSKVPTIPREEFDGTWIVKRAERKEVVGESPVEITFDLTNSRIYGFDGCNFVNGTFTLGDENELQFGSLISTQKECAPEVTDRAVLRALANTRSYKRAHGDELKLRLCDRRGRTIMILEKRMVDELNGAWRVTAIEGTAITDEQPKLVIDIPEAKLSGFAGCNRIFGNIALDGTAYGISFTQVASSRMTCPEIETEVKFLSALEKVTGFTPIDNTHVVLYQQPDIPLITLEKGL